MAKNGYAWTLDGPLPVLEDHSRAKHQVLRAYLVNYLRILAQSPHSHGVRVSLVDGFAGGGLYQTEHGSTAPGSPFILLDALAEARTLVIADRLQRGLHGDYAIHAHVHLVEAHRGTYAFLQRQLAQSAQAHHPLTTVHLHNTSFASALPSIIASIRASTRRGGRSVFIADQYGWSQVDLSLIRSIFEQLPRAEVFLTWMVDNLINVISEQTVDKLNSGLAKAGFGDHLDAKTLLALKHQHHNGSGALTWRRVIQSLLADDIRRIATATYCTPFYIVPRDSRRGYWLLHLAHHLRANEEMKRIHWENNNLHHPGGAGLNMLGYIGSNGQLAFDNRFDDTASVQTVEALCRDISVRVANHPGPLRFGDLVAMTANETPAQRSHMQEAVFTLARSRDICLRTLSGAYRRGAHGLAADDVIERPRQLWLLP